MVRPDLGGLWSRAVGPRAGFARRAGEAPSLGEGVTGLLLVRTVPAFLALLLGYLGFSQMYGHLCRLEGPVFDYLWANLPEAVDPGDVRAAFKALPALPSWIHVAPWLAVLAPLGILSLWCHDAVWDHTCLWLLRGLKGPRSFRTTLAADAEALQVGVFGALFDLLGGLPGTGCLLQLALLPVSVYFWVLRGYALAAWHGCPVWKGVGATLLHAFLAGLLAAMTLGGFLLLILALVRPS